MYLTETQCVQVKREIFKKMFSRRLDAVRVETLSLARCRSAFRLTLQLEHFLARRNVVPINQIQQLKVIREWGRETE